MPVIFLFNVQEIKQDKLEEFVDCLRLAIVQSDDRRKFRKSKIRYFFSDEILSFENEKDGMLIIIGGLFINPGENNIAITTLFQKIRELTVNHFPNKEIVDCMIHPYLFEEENSELVSSGLSNN